MSSRHSSLCVVLLASSVAGQAPSTGGFMDNINFDDFIHRSRTPVEGRMAQDRQGGAPGFAAPSFNIPFQPNFQFNEFGNFLDSNGGFSQFVSGLGSQGLRQGGGDFVQQTEQRFTRPQIGGGANFKRETEPVKTFQAFPQSVETPSIKVHRHKAAPVRNLRPLKRYDYDADPVRNTEFDREPVRMIQQRHKPSGHMETPRNTDRNFHQFHEDDRETDFSFGNNMRYNEYEKMNKVENDHFEQKVESRELMGDHQTDLNNIFDVKSFDFDFEPEKFSTMMNTDNEKKEKERNFTPPDLVEKFNSPLRKSEAFSYPEEPKMSKLTKERMKTFTDFGSSGQNVQSFKDFKTQDIPKINARVPASVPKPQRQRQNPDVTAEKQQPTFTNFPQTNRKSFQKKSNPTKKPTSPLSFEKIPSFNNFKAYNPAKPTKNPSSKPSKKFPSFMNFKPQTPSISQPNTSFKSNPSPPQKSLSSFTAVTPSESVQPFTNFDPQPKTTPQPQIVSLPPMKKEVERKEPQLPPMPTVPPTPTQKPYNYEKKNFRAPLQQVNKNAGPHQIIRIKAPSRDGRPQPKQLFQTPGSRRTERTDSGFQPIMRPMPTPGQLLIQEVTNQEARGRYQEPNKRYQEVSQEANRRYQEVSQEASRRFQESSQEASRRYQEASQEESRRYQEASQEASRRYQDPSEVVYDNQQPLITLDSVGSFRAQSRPDNFAVNVQASFPTNKKRPVRIQRRLMRLPSPKFSQIIRKSPKTMNVATSSLQSSKETNSFESSRILRPRN